MSSGCRSLLAFYSVKISDLKVGDFVSKATARWVGFSLFNSSNKVLRKPYTALVFIPFEFTMGFLLNAKWALYIRAIASNKNTLFLVPNPAEIY